MKRYLAVLISDIHFTTATLELATYSLKAALAKAEELNIPIVICGDTLDGKAIVRGECMNRLIEILKDAKVQVFMLVGNHDLLNEKGKAHALNFLKPYVNVVEHAQYNTILDTWLIPYQNSTEDMEAILKDIPKGSRIIMHQGVMGANLGHYVQDKTAIDRRAFADFRVISGHYHNAQDIKCGRPRKGALGLFSYVGNPYTLSFAEASDGNKGYRLLVDDGLLESVPLHSRRHLILEFRYDEPWNFEGVDIEDIVWLKISGPQSELDKIKKSDVAKFLGDTSFKLDKIADDPGEVKIKADKMTEDQILDALIDSTSEPLIQKDYLKQLWRDII